MLGQPEGRTLSEVNEPVPIVITSLGARAEVTEAVHSIANSMAKTVIERRADGVIALANGAGGHGGPR